MGGGRGQGGQEYTNIDEVLLFVLFLIKVHSPSRNQALQQQTTSGQRQLDG